VREREAKAAVRDRSVAIGSPTNQCRRPDVNAPKRVFSGAAGAVGHGWPPRARSRRTNPGDSSCITCPAARATSRRIGRRVGECAWPWTAPSRPCRRRWPRSCDERTRVGKPARERLSAGNRAAVPAAQTVSCTSRAPARPNGRRPILFSVLTPTASRFELRGCGYLTRARFR
jgi:hypothetical protein